MTHKKALWFILAILVIDQESLNAAMAAGILMAEIKRSQATQI